MNLKNQLQSRRGAGAELHADVVVVGFGVAGACAAIEAARTGARVVIVERFGGGGASELSGGVVYAGGGTAVQRQAGVADSPADMYAYLREEVGDVVSGATLWRFCAESPDMLEWLRTRGVGFDPSLCPYKTSYPGKRHFLYYSGSESSGAFRERAKPAPRGHRVRGSGASGAALFRALATAVRAAGVEVLPRTRVTGLISEGGRVTGVRCATLLPASRRVRGQHRVLSSLAAKPGIYVPKLARYAHSRVQRWECDHSAELVVNASRGVVLSAGGFAANRQMLRQHAPAHRGGLPLGTQGDDGTGIRLGQEVGGASAELDRVSAWRFITPPSAFLGGLLVDSAGKRICDETRYGAALGDVLVRQHGGRGWLLIDAELCKQALRQVGKQSVWFQWLQVLYLFTRRGLRAASVAGVASAAGVDPHGLRVTVDEHDRAARAGREDPVGKPAEFVRPLGRGPYWLLDVSVRPSTFYPCPMLTLGGLVVDERNGQVLDERRGPIAGLHAAGRSAVGLCSRSYVSGLSLADCVFSGRRAGFHVAARDDGDDQ